MPTVANDGPQWQFWIDAGGTFTDCVARTPQNKPAKCKVLSSGVVKAAAASGSTASVIHCQIQPACPDFFAGYQLRLLDAAGAVEELAQVSKCVTSNQGCRLELAEPLKCAEPAGRPFELSGGEDAPVLAVRTLMGLRLQQPIPPCQMRLGTTRGTNALITRQGARTAFVTSAGFADALLIGNQDRPHLFKLDIVKPAPLAECVIETIGRIDSAGQVLTPLDEEDARRKLLALHQAGIGSIAICLLNAYASSVHEDKVAAIAAEVGFAEVSVSSRTAPVVKLVSRGDTTVADAYLNPVLRSYVSRLKAALPGSELQLMTSAGALTTADDFRGRDSILSGPAGGVTGFSTVAQTAGFDRAIGFDMGGTSTDVSRFDGRCDMRFENTKAGVRISAPMLAIETVAAGGGSICAFDGNRLTVGPASAGADPGPACYGRGGPLTVTDLNFYLGRLPPGQFPFPLNLAAVGQRLQALLDQLKTEAGINYTARGLAIGLLSIANANMAEAVRSVSVAQGYDVRDYLLVAFGGAAGQHACAVAAILGCKQILNHPDAGILSAYGIGMARTARQKVTGIYAMDSEEVQQRAATAMQQMEKQARAEVLSQGAEEHNLTVTRSLDLRYAGLDAFLNIPEPASGGYTAAYHAAHKRLYGYQQDNHAIEVVAARVEVASSGADRPAPSTRSSELRRLEQAGAAASTTIYFDGQPTVCPRFNRADLQPGDSITGPAMLIEQTATTVIDPGWTAEVLSGGELLLTGTGDSGGVSIPDTDHADPVLLELFNNRFAAIATQMGNRLQNTASSVNVKERLDFSCAIFTPGGDLVVNAPHIPVHLGAMSEAVKCTLEDNPEIVAGDVFVSNDPYRGGSHLPDVTVVTPVFNTAGDELLFFTASRAHHAEIGGSTPGSMPPFSHSLAEEGVLIRNFKLVDAGQPRKDALRQLLTSGDFPSRSPDLNLADIAAQTAANQQGAHDLLTLVGQYSQEVVHAYMQHIQTAAESKVRSVLKQLPDGHRTFASQLDNGARIAVKVTVAGDSAVIDFTGTSDVLPGNFNANRAIVKAAVMYCLRCLIDSDIPLNQGVLAPVEIVLPQCLLNPPAHKAPADCAAMVAGNVETSQRVVDVLLGALGVAAASQGTMNNLLFGDATLGYYETICGGAGATATAAGASAVQTHMTNTRLTDPEVLEQRFPARVLEFSVRCGSGGAGANPGGDGVVRRIEFLAPLQVSLLTSRRTTQPYGAAGGEDGKSGINRIQRSNGAIEELPHCASVEVQPGDIIHIETPGGGGWGEASSSG